MPRRCELPLLCVQTLANREQVVVCARCSASAAPLQDQLDLCTASTRRRRLAARGGGGGGTRWCLSGCDEAWCSEECRTADHRAHTLLCPGGAGDSDELMAAFYSYGRRAGETFLLSAAVIGRAACRVLERGGEAARDAASAEARALQQRCEEGELEGEAEEQTAEAWALLRAAIAARVAEEELGALRPLLAWELFARLVCTLERQLLPLDRDSPIAEACAALAARGQREQEPRTLARLLAAARARLAPPRGVAAPSEAEGTAAIDALLEHEAAAAAAESAGGAAASNPHPTAAFLPSTTSTDPTLLSSPTSPTAALLPSNTSPASDDDPRVAYERRASLLAQRAAAIFPHAEFVAWLDEGSLLPHSCLPTLQIDAATPAEAVAAAAAAGVRAPAPLAATWTPLCEEGAVTAPSIAWVDAAAPLHERQRQLRRRFGAGYTCACARCLADTGETGGSPPWMRLAAAALQEGRCAEAAAHARHRLREEARDGGAWHLLGAALLTAGEWTAAHRRWAEGFAAAPQHAGLRRQHEKDERYAPAAAAVGAAEAEAAVEAAETHEGRGGRRILVSARLFEAAECRSLVEAAEEHARRSGGWTTSRHYAVPTTDLPVDQVPALLEWFNAAMTTRLAPFLGRHFGFAPSRLRVHDAFLVKYCAGAQALLPVHCDESMYSLTITLSDLSEYTGGGTYFVELHRSLRAPLGHVVAFEGNQFHAGEPIVRGTRYIIAAFLYTEALEEQPAQMSGPERKRQRGFFARCDGDPSDGRGGFTFGFDAPENADQTAK